VNVLRQRSSFMIVMRVIPFAVPTIESLGLPESLRQLAESERGLILVAGVSGSGKSSTIAAIVHHINTADQRHIVTVENPIEFLHRDLNCSVTQREVGVDTESIAVGLHAALRQDPDVIVVGDIADADTAATVLKAAESGLLVIASLPTPDVTTTAGHLIAMLPDAEREIGRMRLAESVRAILAQQLLPRREGEGRVAAMEIFVATPETRQVLRDPARLSDLATVMARGDGMQTLAQHLEELVSAGTVAEETARAAGYEPPQATGRGKKGRG
jgi:twitching motility protein PilT